MIKTVLIAILIVGLANAKPIDDDSDELTVSVAEFNAADANGRVFGDRISPILPIEDVSDSGSVDVIVAKRQVTGDVSTTTPKDTKDSEHTTTTTTTEKPPKEDLVTTTAAPTNSSGEISLTSIIQKVEDSIVSSAFSIANLITGNKKTPEDSKEVGLNTTESTKFLEKTPEKEGAESNSDKDEAKHVVSKENTHSTSKRNAEKNNSSEEKSSEDKSSEEKSNEEKSSEEESSKEKTDSDKSSEDNSNNKSKVKSAENDSKKSDTTEKPSSETKSETEPKSDDTKQSTDATTEPSFVTPISGTATSKNSDSQHTHHIEATSIVANHSIPILANITFTPHDSSTSPTADVETTSPVPFVPTVPVSNVSPTSSTTNNVQTSTARTNDKPEQDTTAATVAGTKSPLSVISIKEQKKDCGKEADKGHDESDAKPSDSVHLSERLSKD